MISELVPCTQSDFKWFCICFFSIKRFKRFRLVLWHNELILHCCEGKNPWSTKSSIIELAGASVLKSGTRIYADNFWRNERRKARSTANTLSSKANKMERRLLRLLWKFFCLAELSQRHHQSTDKFWAFYSSEYLFVSFGGWYMTKSTFPSFSLLLWTSFWVKSSSHRIDCANQIYRVPLFPVYSGSFIGI